MSKYTEQIWTTLQQAGIAQGDKPGKTSLASPWYVKLLLAFSGWLAAIFILGFIVAGFQFVFRNSLVAGLVGAMMIGGAFAILRVRFNEFVEHLGLATSLAGQALVIYTIFEVTSHNETASWLLVALLEIPLAIFMPNFVHRVFSSFTVAIAFYIASLEMGISYVVGGIVMFIAALCWLNEFSYPQHMKKIRAMGYGLILALVALKCTFLFGSGTIGCLVSKKHPETWAQPWIGEIFMGLVAIYVVWNILQRYGQSASKQLSIITLLGTILVCAVSMKAQGITVGMVILLLGFFGANRILLGLGITSLLFYISSYYYLLDTTLLDKSQSLLVVGLVLLGVRWLVPRIVPMGKETQHV